jgi:hypothetical protein
MQANFMLQDHNNAAELAEATIVQHRADRNASSMIMDEEWAPIPPQAS